LGNYPKILWVIEVVIFTLEEISELLLEVKYFFPHILAHCDGGRSGIKLRLEKMSYFMTKNCNFFKNTAS